MLKPQIPVSREGAPFIGFMAFISLIAALLGFNCVTIILVAATFFVLCFFRDPERVSPNNDVAITSPADGKIIAIEKVMDTKFTEGEAMKVSIFMNIFNVHVNRTPISGTIDKVIHTPGKFYAADSKKSAEYNENCGVVLTTSGGKKIAFVQVAGLIARRIVCWLEPGDEVTRGRRFGLIRFGSRVDVYLPMDTPVLVSVGKKVRAGETILANIK